MSELDKVKEEIGWLKVLFGVLIAVDISLIAWLTQNYEKASCMMLVLCLVAVSIVTIALIWINRSAYKKIDELEEL